ncbi:MAG: site-2 protease family protein [Dehalococcoidia bacterium]|nr:site-2 protease family protein [Dehalococcoidia bacterium]
MKHGISLGRVFGIPVAVHFSWFLIFLLVTASVISILPEGYPRWETVPVAIGASLLFFASLLAHELSHSLVARKYGIQVKGITLFIFGGASQITREATSPAQEAVMAIAGPAASVAVGALFLGSFAMLSRSQSLAQFLVSTESDGLAVTVFGWLCLVNVALALFSLVPGLPLDGGRMLRAAVWGLSGNYRLATRIASVIGQAVGILIIVAGIALLTMTHDLVGGPWLMVVGWFLFSLAPSGYRHLRLNDAAVGLQAGDVMESVSLVPPQLTLENLVNTYALPARQRAFLVSNGEVALGIITRENLKRVSQREWGETRAEQAMTPVARLLVVGREQALSSILGALLDSPEMYAVVVDGGKLVGLISRKTLLSLLRTRSAPVRRTAEA